jgi:hypothetical protein
MHPIHNKIINSVTNNDRIYSALRERLSDILDLQEDMVIRTKSGTLEYFNDKFVTVDIKSFVDDIASGIGFTLARTSDLLYLVAFVSGIHKTQELAKGAKRIFAKGSQLYFESAQGVLIGTEKFDLDHFEDAELDSEDLFHITYSQLLDEDSKVELPTNSKLVDVFLGQATAAAIVQEPSKVNLYMWGDNSYCQCGKDRNNLQVLAMRPFNITKKYNLPAPVQVACLRYLTVFLTVAGELYVIGKAFGNGTPRKIDIGIDDISSIKTSGYYSMLVLRKHYGAVALGSSPNGNLGPVYETKLKDFFKDKKKILNNHTLVDACMGETLTMIKVCDQMITNHISTLLNEYTDLAIICVVHSYSSNKKKRPDPFTNHDASVKRHKK